MRRCGAAKSIASALLLGVIAITLSGCGPIRPAPILDRAPPGTPEPAAAAKPVPPPTAVPGRPDVYIVKQGDTLYSIARTNNLDVRELAAWNNIDASGIRVGQQLRLAPPDGVVTSPMKPPPGGIETRPIDGAPPAVDANTKSQPLGVRVPYSDQTYAQMSKSQTIAPVPESKPEVKPETPRAAGELDWAWPTSGKVVTTFNESSSKGIVIAGKLGQPVLASAAGRVIFSGTGIRGLGKLVVIKHNDVYLSVYAHNSALLVKEGQTVAKGQKISEMGNSDSDSVKLHFEIRRQGKPVDPQKLLPAS